MFLFTGVQTVSDSQNRSLKNCLYYNFYEQISNAISYADKSFLQRIDLSKSLGEEDNFHDTYDMKYVTNHNVDGSPRVLQIQPAGTTKYPGIIISKDDFVRGALIAEAFVIHQILMIHIVRPPQSGKTALTWAVQYHLKELLRQVKQKSLFTYLCIQKALNELQLDLQKDLKLFGESEEYITIKHLLNYKKTTLKKVWDDFLTDDNYHFVCFDEIQIAHNHDGNADKTSGGLGNTWVDRTKYTTRVNPESFVKSDSNEVDFHFDSDTFKSIENVSSPKSFILTISATATAPNKLILDRLANNKHPRIIQAYCQPNPSYEGFQEMLKDGRIVNLPAGSVVFKNETKSGFKQTKVQVSESVIDHYRDWLMSDGNTIAVQRINCKKNEVPFLREVLGQLMDVDSDKWVPCEKRRNFKIILLNGDRDSSPGAISCNEFNPDNIYHWKKFEGVVEISNNAIPRYNFHLSFRDKLFNYEPDGKTLILVCQGLTVGERIAVKKHIALWVEIGSNPNFLLQSVGRLFGYPTSESKKFTGKALINLDSTEKYNISVDGFYDFYENIKLYGVSHFFPDTGYLTESGLKRRALSKLKVTRNPREIDAERVVRGVIDNNVISRQRYLKDKKQHIMTQEEVDAFRKKQEEYYHPRFDIKDKVFTLKEGLDFKGFQRQVHTIGEANFKRKENPVHPRDNSNFWHDYGLMQQAGRFDLLDMNKPNASSGEPMPQQYVNKQIAVITKASDICGICQKYGEKNHDGDCVPWDKVYFDAYDAYRQSLGEPPISPKHPVYIEIEKDYKNAFVPAQFTRPSTFQEDPFSD